MARLPAAMTASNKSSNPFGGLFNTPNTTQTVWIDDFANDPYPRNDKIHFKGDPLALVLSFRDQGHENWKITEKLTNSESWDLPAHIDFVEKSNEIKKYYRNKFIINALKNSDRGMSKFRQDLRNYVESDDPYNVYKNDIPMIVKLPDFYLEDQMMDQMVRDYRMGEQYYANSKGERVLYPLNRYYRKTKKTDQLYFWFRDDSNLIYRINIDPKNPLLHLFEKEFLKKSVKIYATFYSTRIRGQDYTFYSLNHWRLS